MDRRDVAIVLGLGLIFYGTYQIRPAMAFIAVGGLIFFSTMLSLWIPFLMDLRKKRG